VGPQVFKGKTEASHFERVHRKRPYSMQGIIYLGSLLGKEKKPGHWWMSIP